ncbi:MAG: UDP-3-O-(3-hydroxymyristoyl)glucosamine N-acyltransferase [Candidatus Marinimicrobia bacterium]|nr:UDP-3-O-(3-hydroxymyristoyl)glucosamine N-acyltransferase [Candidatus Neomarinimicrobiota bacterium]
MKFSLKEIADFVGGDLKGDPDIIIRGVSEIDNSKEGTITFLGNLKYKKYLKLSKASAFFVNDESFLSDMNGVVVINPQLAIAKTLQMFNPSRIKIEGLHKKSNIDKNSNLDEKVSVGSGAVIEKGVKVEEFTYIGSNTVVGENVIIGKNCFIHPNVTIYPDVIIGDSVIIHSGSVIGCDGFGFIPEKGENVKIPQTGNVIIEDYVEIGSNTVIDRATIGSTKIGRRTKIDNLVHIGHNVHIGESCLITAQVGIAGSVKIGDKCIFAGQSGVVPHVQIGDDSTFAAKAGVTKSISGGEIYAGYPAKKIKDHNKREALINRIEIIAKKLKQS